MIIIIQLVPLIIQRTGDKMLRDDAVKEGKIKPKDREEAIRLGLIKERKRRENKQKEIKND